MWTQLWPTLRYCPVICLKGTYENRETPVLPKCMCFLALFTSSQTIPPSPTTSVTFLTGVEGLQIINGKTCKQQEPISSYYYISLK